MEKIILIGGGGHAKSVIDAIESEGKFEIAGIVDTPERVGQTILDYKIFASDQQLADVIRSFRFFCITVGHVKTNSVRVKLFDMVKKLGGQLPVIKASTSYVSKHSILGEGTVIMHNAFVNSAVSIGKNCIINTSAIIEHDSIIGNHVHVSTGSIVNGSCHIADHAFLGSNCCLRQGIEVEESSIIGAGAVVISNISKASIVVGNPAKIKS